MITQKDIKQIAMDAGFKLKVQHNGELDLNHYVYIFGNLLIARVYQDISEKTNHDENTST